MAMTSNRPYLIRAFFDWIVDNEYTPYISVNALADGVKVPNSYVTEGQIVLNIAPRAVAGFDISNEGISFNGRFGGIPTNIYVPCHAVMGIYAKENGQGMIFPPEDSPPPGAPATPGDAPRRSGSAGKPGLRVVK